MKKNMTYLLVALSIVGVIVFSGRRPRLAQAQPVTVRAAGGVSASPRVAKVGLRRLGGAELSDPEGEHLESVISATVQACGSVPPGPNAGALRRAAHNQMLEELESFASNNPASPWTPSVHLLLGRAGHLRCCYSGAMAHYQSAFDLAAGHGDPAAKSVAIESASGLAKLLALTGHLEELDALEARTGQEGIPSGGEQWSWAREMRTFARKHPDDIYRCGLYCLDQLGRLTQPGQFIPENITKKPYSTNGFSVADLLEVAGQNGLHVHAAMMRDLSKPPVPSVLHLLCEHFLVIKEQHGAFYKVDDPASSGSRWLTAQDFAPELSGCALVSDASPPSESAYLSAIDSGAASAYRGRCHVPVPNDHDDSPPCPTDHRSQQFLRRHGLLCRDHRSH